MPRDINQDGLKRALDTLHEARLRMDGALIHSMMGQATVEDIDRAQSVINQAVRALNDLWKDPTDLPYSCRTGDLFRN